MKNQDYSVSITVNATPHEAFKCINNVSKWFTEDIEGGTEKLNDEFTIRSGDMHFSRQKIVEFVPNKKVVWLVTESKLNFVKKKDEWTNTKISFEISNQNDKTQIKFTHIGLVPELECWDACNDGWNQYIIESLHKLINEGKGKPKSRDKSRKQVQHS